MNPGPLTQSKRNNLSVILLLTKMLIALVSLWLIYRKVFAVGRNRDYLESIMQMFHYKDAVLLLTLVLLFMLCNWCLETIKWKYMIGKVEQLSFPLAFSAVWSGLTISFFTPNRIGEYAGRVTVLSPGNRLVGSLITVVENSSQLAVTLIAGFLAIPWFAGRFFSLPEWIHLLLAFLSLLSALFIFFVFINLKNIFLLISKWKWMKRFREIIMLATTYSGREMISVLLLSCARYSVFCLQFILLLKVFGAGVSMSYALPLISIGFLCMSIIPTIALTELGVRGAVMVYLFSHVTYDPLPVMNATFALWLINLAIPSAIGALFIATTRWRLRD